MIPRRGGHGHRSGSDREALDIDYLKTYASGPSSEVNSILWLNPEFDNNITVFGPQVKALVGRYLSQMIDEISALPHPDGEKALLHSIDLIVPHQANKTMVIQLAERRAERRPALLQHRAAGTRRPRASRWPSTTRCATA